MAILRLWDTLRYMKPAQLIRKFVVAAFLAAALPAPGVWAGPAEDSAEIDRLFGALKGAASGRIESEIWRLWSRSGSAAMDLLLERGRKAMGQGDYEAAIEHFTALTDHAPDFAEGWNARAIAFYHMGRYGQSVADIQHTLALNPRHFGALAGFGAILEAIDQPEPALEVYRAALAIHPHLKGIDEAVKRLETKIAGQDI